MTIAIDFVLSKPSQAIAYGSGVQVLLQSQAACLKGSLIVVLSGGGAS